MDKLYDLHDLIKLRMVKHGNDADGDVEMKAFYCLRYLSDVTLGRHGRLTLRQVRGDLTSIWHS